MEADYVVAIDDSGGIEPLVKWDGSLVLGDHPITIMAIAVLKRKRLEEFNAEWNGLRLEIQSELGCDMLPPIHMRIMWGKSLKKAYRGALNPYYGSDFEQIKQWYTKALRIIYRFNRDKLGISFWTMSGIRAIDAVRHTTYFESSKFLAEMKFLRNASQGRYKKMYAHYHKKITSPLLPMLTDSMLYLNQLMIIKGRRTLELLVDPFADSHGVDAVEVYEAINKLVGLSQIAKVERIANADELPVCQAADVIGYSVFRRTMIDKGYIASDPHMFDIFNRFPFKDATKTNLTFRLQGKRIRQNSLSMTILYALARQQIVEDNPEFADEHMISVETFLERVQQLQREDMGVSVLIDANVANNF